MAGEEAINQLQALLRGEISAAETYRQALDRLGDDPSAMNLRQLHTDHREAANALRQHVRTHGGTPDQSSGVWGYFAKAVEGTATLLGTSAALKALKEGEEQGKADYIRTIQDAKLPADCNTLITTTLLPQTESHIATLDRLLA